MSSLFRPFHQLTVMFFLGALCACTGPVNPMQPNIPNGGRAVAITVKPGDSTHMVVASESGGLFLTTNRGVDWQQVSGSTNFSYADVAYVPGQPNTIVAAAQQDMKTVSGGGIWRSTDGGSTWNRMTMTPPTPDCTTNLGALAVTPEVGSSKLWAGTVCGVAFSTDAGATWQYLPTSANYDNDKTYAVAAPGSNQLKILTDSGVKVSNDEGASWSLSFTGLPSEILMGVHDQIAVSPFNSQHLYWSFNYWQWDTTANQWDGHMALYRSLDNGSTWSSVTDLAGINRSPIVKVTAPTGASTYEIYFGNGGCTFERASVSNSATPTISAWTTLSTDHCDHADLGFDNDGHTPLVLVGDGGLQFTSNGGSSWAMGGAGPHGYAALQITEVTGQVLSTPNLYFATQDNNIWASPDDGATWPKNICCEGFFLNVWSGGISPSDTKFSGVTCSGCGNFISGPVLAGEGGFPDPPNNNGNPRLLTPGSYIQNTSITGLPGNVFDLTTNNGTTWTPRYGFPEDVRDLSKVSGGSNPIVFTAIREPGSTSDGQEIVNIKRITGVTASGTPVLSDITNFGGLGIFPTMFAWYKPFGIDPNDANHFIIPDIVDNVVKTSTDAGVTWTPDTALTSLVTQSGSLLFRSGAFTQISSFGFDGACPGHIMVGTRQAGIFQTYDNGATWAKVDGSEILPNVSAFFFHKRGQAVVSTYGRGLWTVDYDCKMIRIPPRVPNDAEPLIFWKGGYIPISQIHNPDACPVCTWVLLDPGVIVDYVVQPETNQIREVRISEGSVKAFNWTGQEVPLQFRVTTGGEQGAFSGEKELAEQVRNGRLQARGLLVEKNILKGVILASHPMTQQQIPQKKEANAPRIEVKTASAASPGLPVGSAPRIVIQGHNFDSRSPLEVLLDGRPARLEQKEALLVNKSGDFTTSIHAPLNIGGHTILVRQKTSHGVIQDAYTFNVTVQDSPQENRKESPR